MHDIRAWGRTKKKLTYFLVVFLLFYYFSDYSAFAPSKKYYY